MQNEPTMICPKCQATIPLTESLAAPLLAQERAKSQQLAQQLQAQLKQKEDEFRKAADVRIEQAKSSIARDERERAFKQVQLEIESKDKAFQELLLREGQMKVRLDEAARQQADFVRKERELEDQKRDMQLTIQKTISEETVIIRAREQKEAAEQSQLQIQQAQLERESLKKKVEELQRKLEQGSQQSQGEALELQLESVLSGSFPFDRIEPVPKGIGGGDCVQRVVCSRQQPGGTILWESKRTKAWSDGWLAKLREDARLINADVAVIVTTAMPKEVESFAQIDGVYVISTRVIVPVAAILRESLIQVARARATSQGLATKAELVYQYITGNAFKLRVQSVVEAFTTMQEDLEKEKRAIQKQWASRAMQIERVMVATAGLYGDIQGIAGQSVPEINGLSMKLLEE